MENQNRHTCIKCGIKGYSSAMKKFQFETWLTPVKQATTVHYACVKKSGLFSCYDRIQSANHYRTRITECPTPIDNLFNQN